MIEPIYLSVPELAERWKQTPRQILEQTLALRLPVFFPFDGLAFDQADRWLMGHGAADEQRELEEKREWVVRSEAHLRLNAAGLTDEFSSLDRDDIAALRHQITEAQHRIEELANLLESRDRDRRKHEYRGYMRALPDTLWTIQQNGEVTFPWLAMHPLSPIRLAEHEGKQFWDGRLMTLETRPGGSGKPALNESDLLIPIEIVKAAETSDATPPKHVPKAVLQKQAVLDTLRKLGYTPDALPPRTPGREWVKVQAWRELAGRKDLFTSGTFDSTWDSLRKSREIAEQSQ